MPAERINSSAIADPAIQARLDFFLISENFMPSVQNLKIIPSYRSDHSTVVLSFQINEFKRGSGLWKFNYCLLIDTEYLTIVKKCINTVKEQYMLPIYDIEYMLENNNLQFSISSQLFLEVLLMEIRWETISYSSYVKKETLYNEIKKIEEEPNIDITKIDEKKMSLKIYEKKNCKVL